jgi:hypothetical protein
MPHLGASPLITHVFFVFLRSTVLFITFLNEAPNQSPLILFVAFLKESVSSCSAAAQSGALVMAGFRASGKSLLYAE